MMFPHAFCKPKKTGIFSKNKELNVNVFKENFINVLFVTHTLTK